MAAMRIPVASRCGSAERACFSRAPAARSFPAKAMLGEASRIVTKIVGTGNCRIGSVCRKIRCGNFDSLSSKNEGVWENDGDYLNCTVLEAVEVRNGSDDLTVKVRDGRYLRCVYNEPRGSHIPDYLSHPAIVLKIEDGSGLILPIIVLEMPSILLLAALRNIEMARPTVYNIMKEMIETMGYMVKFVRVTERKEEAYYAKLCVVKVGDEADKFSFDIRPSDAINVAVRCKAPIQVNKHLAYNDGLRIVDSTTIPLRSTRSISSLSPELDRPDGEPCAESEEFVLVRNMLIAAFEERYKDAAQWKEMLKQFRLRRYESQ